ncbi:MAG: type I-E CRISPR-associated protein Cse2/CasB [Halothiobacillaceae bacterium]
MSGLIAWLEQLNESDSKVRAVLRRSLAFDPGQYIPAFPYVEPFLKDEQDDWRRDVHYLVAALWAAHWREGRTDAAQPLARACAAYQRERKTASTERRFINLLDADREQLPHRLRQMIALLKEQPIDFERLLSDLLGWHRDDKRIQNAWARDFYRTLNHASQNQPDTITETAE